MAKASIASSVGSAATSAIGAYYSAAADKSRLRFQAKMAEINAAQIEKAAQQALRAGQAEEQGVRVRTAQLKSTQRTAMAANGIALNEGSALQVLTSTDYMGEVDANTVAANAVRAAWGYRVDATSMQNEALMARATASAINPGMAATSSLISSAGQIASQWYSFSKAGAFGSGASKGGMGQSGNAGGKNIAPHLGFPMGTN